MKQSLFYKGKSIFGSLLMYVAATFSQNRRNASVISLLYLCMVFGCVSCKKDQPLDEDLRIVAPRNITAQTVNPQTSYVFTVTNCAYDSVMFTAALYKKDGTRFNLPSSNSNSLVVQYRCDTISDTQWLRKENDNAYIKGIVTCRRYLQNAVKDTAYYTFYALFKPDKPQPTLIGNTVNDANFTPTIEYGAAGATGYKVSYLVYGETDNNKTTINAKEQVFYTLPNLSTAKRYTVYVQAINDAGSAFSEPITVGDIYSIVSVIISRCGTDYKYDIKVGSNIQNDLVVTSAAIYDTSGVLKMNITNIPGQCFSLSSLPTGGYILRVQIKDYGLRSRTFVK